VAAPNVLTAGFKANTEFDSANFHHPLGIQDVNGYLYVLDEWTGTLGSKTFYTSGLVQTPDVRYNILLLRAINSTG
ncbi:MAG: hypothetical protein QW257_00630, partial [Candidatus Micrarchaeaceae archaeon]